MGILKKWYWPQEEFLSHPPACGLEPTSELDLGIVAAPDTLLHALNNALGGALMKHGIYFSPPFRRLGGKLHSFTPSFPLAV